MAALVRPKFTCFFEYKKAGWSESWYPLAAADYEQLRGIAVQYAQRRVLALGKGVSMTYIRVSDDAVLRDTLVAFIATKDGTQDELPDTETARGEDPNTRLVVRVEGGALRRRSWEVAGLFDGDIDQKYPNGYNPGGQSVLAILKLGKWMADNNIGFRIKTGNGPPPTYAIQVVTNVIPIRVGSRKSGRPFGSPVGRRLFT